MKICQKADAKWTLLLLSMVVAALLLVACGNTTPPPLPTYTGNGYTMNYPQGWTYNNVGESGVQFSNTSDPTTTLTINVSDAVLGTTLDEYFTGDLNTLGNQFQSYKTDNTVTVTPLVGREPWKVLGISGNMGGQQTKAALLVDEHPATIGYVYSITLMTKASDYDQAYSTVFQPTLASFKFNPTLPEKD